MAPDPQPVHCLFKKSLLLNSPTEQHQEQAEQQQKPHKIETDAEIEEAGLFVGEILSTACTGACVLEEMGRMDTAEVAAFSFSVSFPLPLASNKESYALIERANNLRHLAHLLIRMQGGLRLPSYIFYVSFAFCKGLSGVLIGITVDTKLAISFMRLCTHVCRNSQAVPITGASAEDLDRALARMLQLTVFLESPVYRQLPYGSLVVRIPQRFVPPTDP